MSWISLIVSCLCSIKQTIHWIDSYLVEVRAKRQGLNWKTERLIMKTKKGVELHFI